MDEQAGRRTALIAITIISFATPFMISGFNIALPMIGREFAVSAITLSWMATAYSLAIGVLMIPFGKLADIHGRKRIFLLGTGGYAVASLLCALAPTPVMLIAGRALQGATAAMIFATGLAILTSVYPSAERGKVLGINVAAVYVGLSAGPFLGGVMVEALGWRSVFWATVPLALLTLAFTWWRVEGEWAGSPEDTFDLKGSAIYSTAVIALMVGFAQLPTLRGAGIIAVGAIAGAGFVAHELRTASPVFDLRLFRGNRVFVFSSLAALIDYGSTASVTFLLSLYLQYIKVLSPREAGMVLLVQPLMQAIFSPLAGRLSDRIAPRYVATVGISVTLCGLIMLTFLGPDTGLGYVVACLLVLGFGFASFSSPNTSAIMGAVEARHYGVASGMVGTMRTFGQMLSMGLAMILFAVYIGPVEIVPANYPQFLSSVRTAFIVSSMLCSIGIVASLARGTPEQSGA